jgi:glucosamine--fructose-6-phosphate aminotransferase (isomerizing)
VAQRLGVLERGQGVGGFAGLVAKYWLESLAGLPTSVEVASEYRYRDSVANPSALVVTISQSGETADTLAALKHAKALGHDKTLSICNVPESSLIRLSALRFLTHAGPEIGVASTKAFTTQLVALYLLTLALAKVRGRLSAEREADALADLKRLPGAVNALLALESGLEQWAEALATRQHALFLGRHTLFPIALEGALKLKEISYIHAEAYPAGELKHGPLALVDRDMPIIVCAPNDALFDKLASNMQEVRARNGELFVLSDAAVEAGPGQHVLALPAGMRDLNPLLYTIPLQLLAYHTAIRKGTDVDKPRNLAKSVTVE